MIREQEDEQKAEKQARKRKQPVRISQSSLVFEHQDGNVQANPVKIELSEPHQTQQQHLTEQPQADGKGAGDI